MGFFKNLFIFILTGIGTLCIYAAVGFENVTFKDWLLIKVGEAFVAFGGSVIALFQNDNFNEE